MNLEDEFLISPLVLRVWFPAEPRSHQSATRASNATGLGDFPSVREPFAGNGYHGDRSRRSIFIGHFPVHLRSSGP